MKNGYELLDERINKFWHRTFKVAMEERILLKDLNLPLARIKRLMKVEEGVRMVASEVPVLFSMITEKFIEEFTLRAWINTEENKRRILQKSDLTAAVKTSEMFDFLIYIVPRNDLSRPFNQLMPNKMHSENNFISGRSGMYTKQPIHDENIMSKTSDSQNFYLHQMTNHGSNEIPSHPDIHMNEYKRDFDVVFNRDMNLDLSTNITPRSFN